MRILSGVGAVTLILLGTLAVFAASFEWWAVVVALIVAAIAVVLLILLLLSRQMLRQQRIALRKVLVELENSKAKQALVYEETLTALQTSRQVRDDLTSSYLNLLQYMKETEASFQSIDRQLKKADKNFSSSIRKTDRHVTLSVRESTRQLEALLQIFQNFSRTKLPMPSTGGSAIDAQALGHLIQLVREKRPRTILELGSGTSTVWLGYLSRSIDSRLVSLDHLEKFLELTKTAVVRHDLSDYVDCRLAPLKDIEANQNIYRWYSTDAIEDLHNIDMVIVDGPPAQTGPTARLPALPVLFERLSKDACVILDDANRDEEQKIVSEWLKLYPQFKLIEEGTSRLAVLQRVKE